jgi:hypothetical protein
MLTTWCFGSKGCDNAFRSRTTPSTGGHKRRRRTASAWRRHKVAENDSSQAAKKTNIQKETIATYRIDNADDLWEALDLIARQHNVFTVEGKDGESLDKLSLLKSRLTDASEVYDVVLSHCGAGEYRKLKTPIEIEEERERRRHNASRH